MEPEPVKNPKNGSQEPFFLVNSEPKPVTEIYQNLQTSFRGSRSREPMKKGTSSQTVHKSYIPIYLCILILQGTRKISCRKKLSFLPFLYIY